MASISGDPSSSSLSRYISTVVVCIRVVNALAFCVLLHSVCDLKAGQVNMQCCVIQEGILYILEVGPNVAEATKCILFCEEISLKLKGQVSLKTWILRLCIKS